MDPKIDELLRLLVDKGVTTEEITRVRNELLEAAYETFMKDALQSLTDDDLRAIEASATQEEANAALKRIYAEKTGKNSHDEMKRIVDEKATELLEKYKAESVIKNPHPAKVEPGDESGIIKAQDEIHSISDQSATSTPAAEASNLNNWQ